jgi:hypothetical protein
MHNFLNKTNGQSYRKKVNNNKYFDTEGVSKNSRVLLFILLYLHIMQLQNSIPNMYKDLYRRPHCSVKASPAIAHIPGPLLHE